MRIRTAVSLARLTIVCSVFLGTAGAAAGPVKLENLPYAQARKAILGYGWRPVKGACAEAAADERETCAAFPEIDRCLSSYPNMCIMGFKKDRRSLVVHTRYGPPSSDGLGDTTIWYLEFYGPNGKRIGGR